MANIHSFPVQQQQQLPPNIQNGLDIFHAHFGYVLFDDYHWEQTVLLQTLYIYIYICHFDL